MRRTFVTWLAVALFAVAGCIDRRPTTFAPSLTVAEVDPPDPTTKTPVVIKFRVGYKLLTGHTNQIMRELVVEANRPGAPTVGKVVRLPLGGRPEAGTLDLGELPTGEHAVVVSVRPRQYPETWTALPNQTVKVKVREDGAGAGQPRTTPEPAAR